MSEAPQVVRVYQYVLVTAMTLILLGDVVAGGFAAKAIVSSALALALALGIWLLLFRQMVRKRSNAARWALVVFTFPLGLLLLAPSAARHCTTKDR